MKTKTIRCDNCNEWLMVVDASKNIGAQVHQRGFIYKNAVLFTNKDTPLHFCTVGCQKEYYDKYIPKDDAISKQLEEVRKEIPRMASEVAERMKIIQQRLLKLKK